MNKTVELRNLEEIIDEVSKKRITTLLHAEQISPFVSKRTIGPEVLDLEPAIEEKLKLLPSPPKTIENVGTEQNSRKKKLSTTKASTNKSPKQQVYTPISPKAFTPMNLDFHAINCSVSLREAEEQRKKLVRHQMFDKVREYTQRYTVAKSRRSNDCENIFHAKENQSLLVDRISDAQVIQQADKLTVKELSLNGGERELEELRAKTKSKLQRISFDAVAKYQTNFRSKYEIIATLLMSIDKQKLLSCGDFNAKLNELIQMFDQLIGKISKGECDPSDIKTAETICKSLNELEGSIISALENFAQQKSVEKYKDAGIVEQTNQAQLQQQQELHVEKAAETETIVAAVPKSTNEAADETDTCPHLNNFERLQEHVRPLTGDESMKKFCGALKKAVAIPVNAISAVSPQHLQDKYEKLTNLLAGKPFDTPQGNVTIHQHPLGMDYCLLLMANIFVNQCTTAKSTTLETVFPIASVIVSIWKRVPQFGTLLLTCIFKEAPLLDSYFVPRNLDENNLLYFKQIGYRVVDGIVEDKEPYLKRQAAVARLYASIMIVSGRKLDSNIAHPHSMQNGWRWFAHCCNVLTTQLNKTFVEAVLTIIAAFLETNAEEMWLTYGRQYLKLMIYLEQYYMPHIVNLEIGGPLLRVQYQLEKILRQGTVSQVKGKLPPGFW